MYEMYPIKTFLINRLIHIFCIIVSIFNVCISFDHDSICLFCLGTGEKLVL